MTASAGQGALAGLRVIDMTLMLAGPYASMLLGDHGAEVIKVEPLDGDYVRTVGPYLPDDEQRSFGGYFQSVNRNKQSIAIDLKQAEGRALLIELVKRSDVLIENYRSGVMDRLGLSYEELRKVRPQLVYAAVRGFGDPRTANSPYVNWPAYDVVAQAMGGIMGITGAADGEPTKVGPGVGDIVPAIMCAFGVMAAVYRARETGRGQFLDVSMVDTVLALCERIVYQYSYEHKVPGPEGPRHPFLSPFGIVPCKDGHVTLACHTDVFWSRLCELIGRPELGTDPRLATEAARRQNSDLVYDSVAVYTLQRTKHELLAELGGQVPFSPVYNVADIAQDPHFAAREMLVELEHPGSKHRPMVAGVPVKMTETPGGVHRRAPLLSEHAEEILAGIGIGAEQLASLRERRIVG
ncbi:Formyl-CoA transferase [Delftia sp. Cs1-4]|uniref:CaiB/BaiF CoA transferase family protein n=1 Tax=Delftia sp. (strain Cs1-4) TaxID=742013 RepID=UPI00020E7D1C|nr:CoA transferase [Delftia sp. Cs1-4]AEF88660.1 Formyl-CoA transferase [Delftia sp. Cs1-4]